MDVASTVQAGWRDHARDPAGVFDRVTAAAASAGVTDAVPLAGILVHVGGEHLGRWSEARAVVGRLRALVDPMTDEGRAVARSEAVLAFAQGDTLGFEAAMQAASDPEHASTPRIRVLALAASALVGHRPADAAAAFQEALALAEASPADGDVAAKALAITANNIAVTLEERTDRDAILDALLEQAATAARHWWEKAGTPLNIERAEYRLAMTRLALGQPDRAVDHAEACLAIVREHALGPGEELFGWLALAKAGRAGARERAAELIPRIEDEHFRAWCAAELARV